MGWHHHDQRDESWNGDFYECLVWMGKTGVNTLLGFSCGGSWCFSSLPERVALNNLHECQRAMSVLAHFSRRAEDMIPECLQAQVQEKLNLSDDIEAFYFFLSWSHPITIHPPFLLTLDILQAADAREIFVQRLLQRLVLENKERPGWASPGIKGYCRYLS